MAAPLRFALYGTLALFAAGHFAAPSIAGAEPPSAAPTSASLLLMAPVGAVSSGEYLALAAHIAELEGAPGAAHHLYLDAAALDAELRPYLHFRAARAALATSPEDPTQAREALSGVEAPYPGRLAFEVRLEAAERGGWPTAPTLRAALGSDDREATCAWLTERLAATPKAAQGPEAALVQLHYARCADDETPPFTERFDVEPDAEARLERAERLYGRVRFRMAAAELDAIDRDALSEADRCRWLFRRARTTYRLRDRSGAEAMYRDVAERCTAPENADERVRSLYAVGDRRHDVGDPQGSAEAFARLLADYPQRSHADDAILYLGRAARERGDRKGQLELVRRALRDYPDGDMVHEIVWEYVEPTYRAGEWKLFLAELAELSVPERDDQYFSQGRLDYFSGSAWAGLGRDDEAAEAWQGVWRRYPFSFYGYLSHLRLREAGVEPDSLTPASGAVPWRDDAAWLSAPEARLWRVGLSGMAADVAAADSAQTDADRWRLALLYDAAGRHDLSHNIVRRLIPGRPWTEPATAREQQWRLAWPNPFGAAVEAAVEAEAEQAGSRWVHVGLPASIMREESSFIEDIESYAGALGLMQLMPRTALAHDDDVPGRATPEKLKTAQVNVRVGVDHLYWLGKRFDGHPALIVAAYNAGSGAVGSWLRKQPNDDIALFVEDIPYLQTRDYTKRVIGSYAAYQWLAGIRELDPRLLGPGR